MRQKSQKKPYVLNIVHKRQPHKPRDVVVMATSLNQAIARAEKFNPGFKVVFEDAA